MAQESSFFNAQLVNGSYDRVYNAENWAAYFASFLSNGIAYTAQNTLLVEASTGMEVLVNTGIAFINGYRYANTTPLAVSINPANSTYNRITSIVIELNLSTRNILIKTLDGEASTNPVAPTLMQNSGVYQLQLATVLVQAGATNIYSGNITDTRSNPAVCGWLGLLMEETNEESQTLQDEISAANQNIATIKSMLNINSENNSLNLNNTNFNNTVVINDALQINEQNGFITFENSTGKDIMDIQVNTDTFVLENAITNNELLSVTPVTSGTDTLQVICNTQLEGDNNFQGTSTFNSGVTINDELQITEKNGYITFANNTGENIMNLQVNTDTFTLQNAITNNALFNVTPVSSGTDTLQVICNTQLEGNSNFKGASSFQGNSNFQGENTFQGNSNFEGNSTFNSAAIVNDELQITEENGYITFANSTGKNIIDFQVDTDTFVITNPITTNNLLQVTPINSGTDTITWSSNNVFSEDVSITENGYLYFQNGNGKNIITAQVNENTFSIGNSITNNNLVQVTPVSNGTDTLQVICNTQLEGNNSFQGNNNFEGNSTFNSTAIINDELQITEKNGFIAFENSTGKNIMDIQVDTDTFILYNPMTKLNLLQVTPVSSGTDTLQIMCNTELEGTTNFNNTVVVNNALQINEQNGFITFENSTGKNIMDIQVNTDTFVLENPMTNNELLSVTPVASGTDTLEMSGNVNFSGDGVLQINGERAWNGGNGTNNSQLSGQFALPDDGGAYVNYNIQYWTLNMGGVVNPTTPPQCGIGVITVQLTPSSNNVNWSGYFSLVFSDLPGISGLQAMMINQNQDFTLALNQEIEALMINNVNIAPNPNSNTPNTYTATAILLN